MTIVTRMFIIYTHCINAFAHAHPTRFIYPAI